MSHGRSPPPTDAQRAAADPTCSVWVTANAGTGKTRVLADRVLRLLLAGSPPNAVLGLTFTKAAAAEMSERIESRLASWAAATTDDLEVDLGNLLGRLPHPEEAVHARRLFDRILDLPAGLSISTIHSLASTLLRQFPLEAGVSPHFSVIDERSAEERVAAAKAAVFEAAAVEGSPMAYAVGILAGQFADQSINEVISEAIGLRRHLWEGLPGDDGSQMHNSIQAALGASLDAEHLLQACCAETSFDRAGLERVRDVLTKGGKTHVETGELLHHWLAADSAEARIAGWTAYVRAWFTKKGEPRKKVVQAAATKANPELLALCAAEQDRIAEVDAQLRAIDCAKVTNAILTVGAFAVRHAELHKHFEGELDYDDLIAIAGRLLADSTVRDWVLYKLDARIDHVLVDEAQDTGPEQWAIIEQLVDDFFTGESLPGRHRTLFVVGDEKQSIYGFQGADLKLLREVRARLGARAAAVGRPIRNVVLDTSFRSTEAVLAIVDRVFEMPDAKEGVLPDGSVLRHATSRLDAPGVVGIWPIVPADTQTDYDPWQPATRPDIPETGLQRIAAAIASFIQNSVARREPADASGQPFRAQDFLVLVRKRGQIQDLVIRALKRRGIAVAGADRFTLVEHLAVRDMLALGAVLLFPEDDLKLACVLKSPLIELNEEQLFELAYDRGQSSLIERLRARVETGEEVLVRAYHRLEEWIARADFMPPYELFCHVLGAGGARERFVERMGREVIEPLEAFLSECLTYEQGHPASLSGFLHWLSASEAKLKRDAENSRDEVRVLTVHGAKGLEAPVVILADAGPGQGSRHQHLIKGSERGFAFLRGSQGKRPQLVEELVVAELQRELEEDRRLLYVALTRARDRLYVAGWGEEKAQGEPSWHARVTAALEAQGAVERTVDAASALLGGEVRLHRKGAHASPAPQADHPAPNHATSVDPAWLRLPARSEDPPVRGLAPSRAGGNDPPPSGTGGAGRAYGTHAHRLLQLLPEMPLSDRDAAGARYLERYASDLPMELRFKLGKDVVAVLDHPELRVLFGPTSRAEQAITGWIDGIPVSGQIDRLAIEPDAIHLIDFKTSPLPPDRVEDTPVAYLRQMSAYAALLERRFVNRPIRAALVWTETLTVVRVPSSLLLRHRPVPNLAP